MHSPVPFRFDAPQVVSARGKLASAERRWAAELPQIRKEVLRRRRDHGDAAMAEILAAFTDACARQAAQTATS
ncbi:hypothetical protein [Streptomyces sp. NBRC 110028]|uniref:hypothetical protein n=1 Tax=Streptomyces sp. NBRC 110028 TaxID=1621260 RepID=UPI0006E3C460|nr:hypothetical protein [Streptomyces sp. NBRC 110028]